jgi:hypothetical protein
MPYPHPGLGSFFRWEPKSGLMAKMLNKCYSLKTVLICKHRQTIEQKYFILYIGARIAQLV